MEPAVCGIVGESRFAAQLHFVGRGEEISLFQEQLHVARRRGTGSVLIFAGKPGIGKSRLLHRCAELASSTATVLSAACSGSSTETRSVLSQLLHQLDANHEALPTGSRLFAQLKRASARRSVVIFADDIQFAGLQDFEVIDELVSEARQSRIVFVGSFAQLAAFPPPALASTLNRWRARNARILTLNPLSNADVGLLMRNFGISPTRIGSATELSEFLRLSAGNPRYVEELLQRDTFRDAAVPSPPYSARTIVSIFVSATSPDQSNVLKLAAVCGDDFSGSWLRELSDCDDDTIASALQAAADAGLIREHDEHESWYAFTDHAIQTALYATVVQFKRRLLHQRVAELLGSDSKEDFAERIAEHWNASGDPQRAVNWLSLAARSALTKAQHRRAATLFERAAARCAEFGMDALELQERAAACYQDAGAYKSSLPLCESIVATISPEADPRRYADAVLALVHAYWWTGKQDEALGAMRILRSVADPNLFRMVARETVVWALRLSRNGLESESLATLSMVRRHDLSRSSKPWYLLVLTMIYASSRGSDRSIAKAQAAADLARRSLKDQTPGWLLIEVTNLACRLGRIDIATSFAERALRATQKSEDTSKLKLWTSILRIEVHLYAGELTAAHALLLPLAAIQDTGPLWEANLAALGVSIGLHMGDRTLLDAFFDVQILRDAIDNGQVDLCGMLLESFPKIMVARSMLHELTNLLRGCAIRGFSDPHFSIQLAIAEFGSLDDANAVLAYLERKKHAADGELAGAALPLAQALVNRRIGDSASSKRAAGEAAKAFQRLGWKLREAFSLELSGNNSDAHLLYKACGAEWEARRLLLRQTRKRTRAYFGASLTLREQEIAQLMCERAGNKTIAEMLCISERTVHHHVEAIFSKLGIRARWQLKREMVTVTDT